MGVLGGVTDQLPHLVGVRGDAVLHIAHTVLRRTGERRSHGHDALAFGILELIAEDVVHLRVAHPEEAQCPRERRAGLLGCQPISEEPAERRHPGAGADQDDVLLRFGPGAERLACLVHPGPDAGAGGDIGKVVRRDALEQSATRARRGVQHADDQRHLLGGQPR